KQRLLRDARFAIYPSLFEGFGLPVVECMAQGCPIITSRSSSLIELGLEDRFYLDPLSLADFARAFGLVQSVAMQPSTRRELAEELRRRAASFTWDKFGARIVDRVEEHVATLYPGTARSRPRARPP